MILTLFLTNQQLVAKSVHSGRNMNEELCKLVVIFAEFAIYNQQLGIMLGNLQNTSQIFQIARCPILLYHLWLHLPRSPYSHRGSEKRLYSFMLLLGIFQTLCTHAILLYKPTNLLYQKYKVTLYP